MTMKLSITSGKKGSNPGGECTLYERGRPLFKGYFKYCHSSRVSGASSLTAKNQPIYEAITLHLARSLGLRTTNFYVVLNSDGKLEFEGWKENELNDPSKRPFYFLSKLIPQKGPCFEREKGTSEALEKDRVYLESLLVEDVINKRQNYAYNAPPCGDGRIDYIDLGCSFVHAVHGTITVSKSLSMLKKRELKRLENSLKGKVVICAANKEMVDLEKLAQGLYSSSLPVLNPEGKFPLKDLLSEEELDEIYSYTVQGLHGSLKEFGKRGLFLNDL